MKQNVDLMKLVESRQLRKGLPSFNPGDAVAVHLIIKEGGKERVQLFRGLVIAKDGSGSRETFTVRKVSFGVGVERVFLLHSPAIQRIEVGVRGDVNRAKLYFLRGLRGKKSRIETIEEHGEDTGAMPSTDKEAEVAVEISAEEQQAQQIVEEKKKEAKAALKVEENAKKEEKKAKKEKREKAKKEEKRAKRDEKRAKKEEKKAKKT